MASGSIPQAAPSTEMRSPADKLIETQLSKVRRQIRVTDLFAGLLVLLAGVLAFLTVAAVIDHWIVGLGTIGRWGALVILLVGAGWHLIVNVIPLLVRRINPAYAAQTIEQSEPALKNSLINYLLLPREREGVAGLIYRAVQQRAAADVARVEVDQTVDRTVLIRAGYLLAGMMVLAGAYKILSPKDPFQTVRRIATPWADIERPARVAILSIEPGDAEVFQGETVELSVIVRGARDEDAVVVTYSTVDQQIVDRTATMQLDSGGLRHVLQFPPDGRGVQQETIYRISVGDAESKAFRLRVSPTPVMTVESVHYEYPTYTRKAPEVVERQGDLKGVEGTRVTVHTRATQPIGSATVEFFSVGAEEVQRRLPLEFRDATATGTWNLELDADRHAAQYSAYQTRFTTKTGEQNRDPVRHRIEVVPDLVPELEFLTPQRENVEVSVGGAEKLEIRAVDPDYGLTELRLKAIVEERTILDLPLFEDPAGQVGQVIQQYMFRPADLQLAPGTRVRYWAVATDNRAPTGSPEPNVVKTPERTLTIIADPARDGTATQRQRDRQADSEGTPTTPEPQAPGKEPGAKSDPQNDPNSKPDQANKDDAGAQSSQKSGAKSDAGGKSESQSGDKQETPDGQGGAGGGSGKSSQSEGQGGQQGGDAGMNQPSTSRPGQGADSQTPGGTTPQDSTTKSSDPASAGGDPSTPGQTGESTGDHSRTEPAHDGEVFERALQRLQREGERPPNGSEGSGQSGTDEAPGTEDAGTDSTTKQGAEEQQGANKSKESPNADRSDPATKGDRGGQNGSRSASSDPMVGDAKSDDSEPGPQPGPRQTPESKPQSQPGAAREKGKNGEKSAGSQGAAEKGASPEARPSDASKGEPSATPSGKPDAQPPREPADGGKRPEGETAPRDAGANNPPESAGAGDAGKEPGRGGEQTPKGERPMSPMPKDASQTPADAPPPNQSERSSDSQGQQSGDRSGGGKQGAGQSAQQSGNDNAGSQKAADEGAEGSAETGAGDSTRSGGDQKSPGKTGAAGKEKGSGTSSQADPAGQRESGASGDPGTPGADSQPGAKGGKPSGDPSTAGSRDGGGSGIGAEGGVPPAGPGDATADAANLDYARRATDMVLEYLKDQRDKPDDRLLDDLGWTAEDLQNFVNRWEQLKQRADEDPAARRELDDTLRGLGLRPARDQRRQGSGRSDDFRGMRESGIRSAPPAAYQEQFNAFKKGTARSQPQK